MRIEHPIDLEVNGVHTDGLLAWTPVDPLCVELKFDDCSYLWLRDDLVAALSVAVVTPAFTSTPGSTLTMNLAHHVVTLASSRVATFLADTLTVVPTGHEFDLTSFELP